MSDATAHETRHGGLTLQRFAELSALVRMPSAAPLLQTLAAQGLDPVAWKAAQAAWNRAIKEDLERGNDGLVVAFADALAEAKERLRAAPPPGEEAAPVSVAPVSVAPASYAPAAVAPASYAPGSLVPATVPMAVANASLAPAFPQVAPVAQGAPAGLAPVAPAPPGSTAPPLLERPGLGATAHLPLQNILARILPFDPAARAAPQTLPNPPAQAAAPVGHAAIPPAQVVASSARAAAPAGHAAIPPAQAGAPPAQAALHPAAGAGGNEVARPRSASLSSTADLEIPRSLPPSLPFAGRAGAAAGAQAKAPPAPPPAPRLTLEQYASLQAERAEHPEREMQIRARYFVAQAEPWAALQREWQQRMDADPALRLRAQDLINHYRKWLQRTGG